MDKQRRQGSNSSGGVMLLKNPRALDAGRVRWQIANQVVAQSVVEQSGNGRERSHQRRRDQEDRSRSAGQTMAHLFPHSSERSGAKRRPAREFLSTAAAQAKLGRASCRERAWSAIA